MYRAEHLAAWKRIVDCIHARSSAKIALQLNHAGRRGSTRPRWRGLDRPLREGNWPLLSASPLPYTPQSQVPKEMDQADMEKVRDDFVRATHMAQDANFDMLQLHFAQGYLLAKAHGCDLITVLAGQTTLEARPVYDPGFLIPLSDRVRNEALIATMTGGYLTIADEINSTIAAGRADLCLMDPPHLRDSLLAE